MVEHLACFKSNRLDAGDHFHSLNDRASLLIRKWGTMAKPKLQNMPDLSQRAVPGAEISVTVTPKAARDGIAVREGAIRIAVTAPPENGKANAAVRAILAKAMGVAPSKLTLKRGQTSREKTFVYSL